MPFSQAQLLLIDLSELMVGAWSHGLIFGVWFPGVSAKNCRSTVLPAKDIQCINGLGPTILYLRRRAEKVEARS